MIFCILREPWRSEAAEAWRPELDASEERNGSASRAKRDAALEWSGREHQRRAERRASEHQLRIL
jgi:hypothetical protein